MTESGWRVAKMELRRIFWLCILFRMDFFEMM